MMEDRKQWRICVKIDVQLLFFIICVHSGNDTSWAAQAAQAGQNTVLRLGYGKAFPAKLRFPIVLFPSSVAAMKELPHTQSCFVCGESNPIGFNLRSETDGRIVRMHFVPKHEHVGFAGIVHGGLIATLLDEVMVWACAVQTRRFAFCAELNVRYLEPLRPGERTVLTAELISNRRDRVFEAQAEIASESGVVFAKATGKYLPVKNTDITELTADFIGDPKVALG